MCVVDLTVLDFVVFFVRTI